MRPVTVTMAVVALLGGLATPASADIASVPEDPEVRVGVPDAPDRLSGGTRIETAAQIARYASRMRPAPDRVYLARADEFVDALAAGTLRDGPILFAPRSGPLPEAVRDVIDDLDPGQVVALGGPEAIPDAVLTAAADGRGTDRIAGPDRYATATEIARAAWEGRDPTTVYVARADVPVDALAGGFLTDGPVLLLPRSGPAPEVVRQTIADLDPAQVLRLGGDQAISTVTVLHAAGGRSWGQLAGPDRYSTAARISQRIVRDGSPTRTIYLARADVFADAVVAGALPDGVLLLADPCGPLPTPTAERLASVDALNVVALGGPTALCDQTLREARAGVHTLVLSGSDRDDDRRCTEPGGDEVACTGQTLEGEILEGWVDDARDDGGSLSFSVRLPSLHDVPEGAPHPSMPRFSYEDPDSDAAIRFESQGFTFDLEVLRPDGSTDTEAASKYKGSPCFLGSSSGRGTDAFSTLRRNIGEDPACFDEVDFDTWELTIELRVGEGEEAAVDRLTLVP